MEKLNRWIAKHQTASKIMNIVIWVIVGVLLLEMGWPAWLVYTLIVILGALYVIVISAAGDTLIKKPLEILRTQCDPYPFLEEMRQQQSYPANDATKQIRTINYALALRCIGEYEQAFALLSTTNIDKHAGMLPVAKVSYYNNLMDLCALMGRHQEAILWYEKTAQIFHDMKPGKQKEKLRNTVESNRATYHFCKGEWEQALQVLGRAKIENLNDRIENAMMYARVYLALGESEKAVRPLTFVAENGNKLYFATEARKLLASSNTEE